MNNFTFYSPTYFVFGKDKENSAGKYVKRFGGSKVLIHYGGGSVVRTGLLDQGRRIRNSTPHLASAPTLYCPIQPPFFLP